MDEPQPSLPASRLTIALARITALGGLLTGIFGVFAGLVLFVFPLRTAEWFAWTVNPPMTAVFLGAAYWSAAGLEVTLIRALQGRRAV